MTREDKKSIPEVVVNRILNHTRIVKAFVIQTLFLLLYVVPLSALSSEWKELGLSQKSKTAHYYDEMSIKRVGSEVYFLSLSDYLEPNKFGELSSINYNKINCETRIFTYLSQSYYLLPMGRGDPSITSALKKTALISTGSVNDGY